MSAVPAGPPVGSDRAARAIAFCPAPPLLLPVVEGRADAATTAVRRACTEAVAAMLAVLPEVVVVVGAGAVAGVRFGAGDGGDLTGFGIPVTIPFQGRIRPGGLRVPLPHTLGAWLLDEAGYAGTRVGLGPDDLERLLRHLPGPVGVLAMADGSARRGIKAPGYLDEAAEPFDAAVAAALASGNAPVLADLDPVEGHRLLAEGVPTWRAVGAAVSGRDVAARLLHDAAPFGVGYPVAHWVVS